METIESQDCSGKGESEQTQTQSSNKPQLGSGLRAQFDANSKKQSPAQNRYLLQETRIKIAKTSLHIALAQMTLGDDP